MNRLVFDNVLDEKVFGFGWLGNLFTIFSYNRGSLLKQIKSAWSYSLVKLKSLSSDQLLMGDAGTNIR